MTNYTARLDKAIKIATWAHGTTGQLRKGTDVPFIIHPYGVMTIASLATNDEDILIACLLHDILEDVAAKRPDIYNEELMREDFGDRVTAIVKDVTHDDSIYNWHKRNQKYLDHIANKASQEAVIVSTSDKIHNLLSIVEDYKLHGQGLARRFSTNNLNDQLWWYGSVYEVAVKRDAPRILLSMYADLLDQFKTLLKANDN
jgi:(p)ppGpp synthase/HD superfamily hydrolase